MQSMLLCPLFLINPPTAGKHRPSSPAKAGHRLTGMSQIKVTVKSKSQAERLPHPLTVEQRKTR